MSIEDACKHLRIEHSDDDDYVQGLVEAATAHIEGPSGIGLALHDQTWQLRIDGLPRCFRIALGPIKEIISITVDGLTLDPTLYRLFGEEVRGSYMPRIHADTLVTFTAGFGDDLVPADLIHAAKLLVGHFYANREAAVAGGKAMEVLAIPMGVEAILSRYRRY